MLPPLLAALLLSALVPSCAPHQSLPGETGGRLGYLDRILECGDPTRPGEIRRESSLQQHPDRRGSMTSHTQSVRKQHRNVSAQHKHAYLIIVHELAASCRQSMAVLSICSWCSQNDIHGFNPAEGQCRNCPPASTLPVPAAARPPHARPAMRTSCRLRTCRSALPHCSSGRSVQ